jgi:hypothetical protein
VKTAQASLRGREDLAPKDRNNLLFYVAMHASAALAGVSAPSSDQLATIAPGSITDVMMNASIATVEPIYRQLGANDQTAKGTQFLAALKAKLSEQFP